MTSRRYSMELPMDNIRRYLFHSLTANKNSFFCCFLSFISLGVWNPKLQIYWRLNDAIDRWSVNKICDQLRVSKLWQENGKLLFIDRMSLSRRFLKPTSRIGNFTIEWIWMVCPLSPYPLPRQLVQLHRALYWTCWQLFLFFFRVLFSIVLAS